MKIRLSSFQNCMLVEEYVQHADTFKTSKSFLKYLSLLHAFIFVTLMLLMCSGEMLLNV